MIDSLPLRYRVTLWVVGVIACIGAGAWLAFSTPLPVVWQYGAVAGAIAAPLLVTAFCRTLGPRSSRSASAPPPGRTA